MSLAKIVLELSNDSILFSPESYEAKKLKIKSVLSFGNTNILVPEITFYDQFLSKSRRKIIVKRNKEVVLC